LKQAFFKPTDVGGYSRVHGGGWALRKQERAIKAAQKAVDVAEEQAEIARKRAASSASTATPTKRIYKPKRASQLTKKIIVDPRLEIDGIGTKQRRWQRVSRPGGLADSVE
jgi:hypothetical protein